MSRTSRCTAVLVWLGLAVCLGLSGCAEIDERPATWSYVHATIIEPNCTTSNCHSWLASTAGLRFDNKEDAYAYLTGRICDTELPGQADHNFVVPGEPERSKLMYLLRGEEVRRMPPDTALPDAEIELVERWIAGGALCD